MMDNDADENSLIMKIFEFVKNVSLLYFCESFFCILIFYYMPNVMLLV